MNPAQEAQKDWVVPDSLRYTNVLPQAIPSTSRMRKYQPNNGARFSYTANRTIRIPLGADAFMSGQESYLNLTMVNLSKNNVGVDTDMSLDHSIHSLFQAVRLEGPDGTIIDDIENYNVLSAMVSDIQHGSEWRATQGGATQGYARELSGDTNGIYALPNYDDGTHTFGPLNSATDRQTFSIPLIGTFLSNQKMIPLKYLGNGLTLELRLADPRDVLVAPRAYVGAPLTTNVANYEVENVEYVAKLLTFTSEFYQAFEQLMEMGSQMGDPQGSIVQMHSPAWHNWVYSSGAGGSFNVPIAEKATAIKSIFAVLRNQHQAVDSSVRRIGGRVRDNIIAYQFRSGSILYPPTPVKVADNDASEAYSEVLKAFGTLHSIEEPGSVMRLDDFTANASENGALAIPGTAVATYTPPFLGKYCIGHDWESFHGYQSGLNTTSHNNNVELLLTRAGGGAVRVDVFSLIDQVVELTRFGTLVVKR